MMTMDVCARCCAPTAVIMAATTAARITAVTGDVRPVAARLGSKAMDTNTRLAILAMISLFGEGGVWTLVLSRRCSQLAATRFHEHEARPDVADFRQAAPAASWRQK